MAAAIRYNDRVVFVGDSITENGWYAVAGGLIAQLGALGASLTVINSGVSGNKVADLAAAVPARVTNYNPNVVVIFIGANDASAGTPPATFRASYDSLISKIVAFAPGVQIVCLSILCQGELWSTSGPSFAGNAFDSTITSLNAEIAGAAAGCATYVDIRTQGARYEAEVNTPAPGAASGFLTSDGLHPNATGSARIGTWTLPAFNQQPSLASLLARQQGGANALGELIMRIHDRRLQFSTDRGAAWSHVIGVGLPRQPAIYLPNADITINPNTDNCALYVLLPETLTAPRVLTVDNAGGDNSKIVQIAVRDTSSHTYDIRNSTPTLQYQKTANRPAATYQLFHSGGTWNANIHYWTA